MDRVYFISLRTLDTGVRNLTDILKDFHNPASAKILLNEMLQNDGCKTCFILDGLEDFRDLNNRDSVIYRLLHRTYLPHAALIVTSRPVASASIRDSCTVIEVLGFTEEHLFQYIQNYSFRKEGKLDDLKQFLEGHPNILLMCHLPLHAAMICFLYSQLEDDIPCTETQIYKYFMKLIILRTLKHLKYTDHIRLNSLDSLDQEAKDNLKKVCSLAFTGIITSQQVVSQKDIDVYLSEEGGIDEPSLGLVTIDSTPTLFGYEDSYTFHHRTFQEYCAAYHIAQLEEDEQVKILRYRGKQNDMSFVWKFYCGLVDFKNDSGNFENFIGIQRDDLFRVQCAFESQQTCICDSVVRQGEPGDLTFQNHVLSWADFAAISFVMTTASSPVIKLKFIDCTWKENGLKYFSVADGNKLNSVQHLCYRSSTRKNLEPLNSLLRVLFGLEELDLQTLKISVDSLDVITKHVHLPKLRILKLPRLPPGCQHIDNFKSFSACLKEVHYYYDPSHMNCLLKAFGFRLMDLPHHIKAFNMHLDFSGLVPSKFLQCTRIVLFNCLIDDNRCIVLTNGLKGATKLHTLELGFNMISANGVVHLANWLRTCTTIKSISLHCNQIDDCGALTIGNALIHCSNLEKLDMQYNAISDVGAIAIADSLQGIPASQLKLYLWNMNITKDGIASVLKYQKNTSIEHGTSLQSTWKFIIKSGSEAFSNALKCCSRVPTLEIAEIEFHLGWMEALVQEPNFLSNITHLSLCYIKKITEGIAVLAQGLKWCNKLQTLNLSGNLLKSDSIGVLVPELESCQCLRSLDLSGNSICTHGAEMLADGLNSCSTLRWLNLSDNIIGPDGAQALEDRLTVSISVNLSRNPIESGSERMECLHQFETENQIHQED